MGDVKAFALCFPQNRASWYWRLVRQAASWGVLVLQYDTSGLPSVAAELHLFPELIQAGGALPPAAGFLTAAVGCCKHLQARAFYLCSTACI